MERVFLLWNPTFLDDDMQYGYTIEVVLYLEYFSEKNVPDVANNDYIIDR
jgi:hypothetical protein